MTKKPIIVIGAGGHAKVVIEALMLSGREVIGLLTPDQEKGAEVSGVKVLGGDSVLSEYDFDEVELANGIGSIPKHKLRWKIAEMMRCKGYCFVTVVHPNSIISSDVFLEEGVQVMAGVIIQSGVVIGKDSIINTGAIIDHDCNIAENCHLAPGVVCCGGVAVGKDAHIGAGAKIIQGVQVGNNSVVAAGTVVFRDVNASQLVRQSIQIIENSVEK